MIQTASVSKNSNGALIFLAAASLVIVAGVLLGKTAEFGISDRTAFIVLAVVGFSMCALSPLGKGAVYGWLNPLHLVGYVLGVLTLLLCVAVLANLTLPGLIGVHSGVPALAAVIVTKILVANLYPHRS